MIHQATEWLKRLLTGPQVGLQQVFDSAAEIGQHARPPYAAILIDQEERYRRVEQKVAFQDDVPNNRRIYTYERIRAALPVSVVLVEQDRARLEQLRTRFLAALPPEFVDSYGQTITVTPQTGQLVEDASRLRGGVAIEIVVEFEGAIYATEEVPLFSAFEITEVVVDKPEGV